MLTDTHCHLDLDKFDEDRKTVLERALAAGVERILIPGLDLRSSVSAIQLAESHPRLYAAVGFHPTDLKGFSEKVFDELRDLAGHAKVVAVGEIGIDYYWVKEEEKRLFQHDALKKQLTFAASVGKPVVIHMREENDAWFGQASVDLLNILTEWQNKLRTQNHPLAEKPGVMHSFNGTLETAQKAMDLNFYIGITGTITYETDAPFLTPVPHRGKRNEPAFVAYIADKIAEIHKTTREQVAKITAVNAERLFGWGG
jgi:TatD DNase family protein